jgi:hypothetical protein
MERMGFIIEQMIKRYNSKIENSANSKISNALIGHQLYGPSTNEGAHLVQRLNEVFSTNF